MKEWWTIFKFAWKQNNYIYYNGVKGKNRRKKLIAVQLMCNLKESLIETNVYMQLFGYSFEITSTEFKLKNNMGNYFIKIAENAWYSAIKNPCILVILQKEKIRKNLHRWCNVVPFLRLPTSFCLFRSWWCRYTQHFDFRVFNWKFGVVTCLYVFNYG